MSPPSLFHTLHTYFKNLKTQNSSPRFKASNLCIRVTELSYWRSGRYLLGLRGIIQVNISKDVSLRYILSSRKPTYLENFHYVSHEPFTSSHHYTHRKAMAHSYSLTTLITYFLARGSTTKHVVDLQATDQTRGHTLLNLQIWLS